MGNEYNLEIKAIVKYRNESSFTAIRNLNIRFHFEFKLVSVDEVAKVLKFIKIN